MLRRKKGEEKTIQIKIIKANGLRLPQLGRRYQKKTKTNKLLFILPLHSFPLPPQKKKGHSYPSLKIQHGKDSVCTIPTVIHEHPFARSSDVSYDVERTLVMRSGWGKLLIRVEDEQNEIGRTEINTRGLLRGIKVVRHFLFLHKFLLPVFLARDYLRPYQIKKMGCFTWVGPFRKHGRYEFG
eukprot:TRINITY_DN7476_c0_g1_i1.p1 TRINITY_DN7476_c0_g1~~TRINITY_DN7476_c0_g1_i1.p1  ORF type:complete len:183 (-),score=30.32 TRINITY_DN7476_c0_g1_i1:167-715(-)